MTGDLTVVRMPQPDVPYIHGSIAMATHDVCGRPWQVRIYEKRHAETGRMELVCLNQHHCVREYSVEVILTDIILLTYTGITFKGFEISPIGDIPVHP
jgi:hypothetical protein